MSKMYSSARPQALGRDALSTTGFSLGGDRTVNFAFLLVGDAPVGVGKGKFRVERDGFVVVGDGTVNFALPGVGPAPVVVARLASR